MSAEDYYPTILEFFVEQVRNSGTGSILMMTIDNLYDAPQLVTAAYVYTSNNPNMQGAHEAWRAFGRFCRRERPALGLTPRQLLQYMNMVWDVFSAELFISSYKIVVDRHIAKENGVFSVRALNRDWDDLIRLEYP